MKPLKVETRLIKNKSIGTTLPDQLKEHKKSRIKIGMFSLVKR